MVATFLVKKEAKISSFHLVMMVQDCFEEKCFEDGNGTAEEA